MYFDVAGSSAEGFHASADAFLVAALPLALLYGEREVEVAGALSPILLRGLGSVMERFGRWDRALRPVEIVPSDGLRPVAAPPDRRAACFLSGGVDSLAMLRENRMRRPTEHPESMTIALHFFGLNAHDLDESHRPVPERWARFEEYRTRLEVFASQVGLELIPIRTNIRALYPDFETWGRLGWSAGIVAAAHHFRGRLTDVWLADWGPETVPSLRSEQLTWLDRYRTEAVRPHVGQPGVTRLPKVGLVAEWSAALGILRTCVQDRLPPPGVLNCGRCPKCVRTLLALIALDARERAVTFPSGEITPEMLAGLRETDPDLAAYLVPVYEELLDALRGAGASAYATSLEQVIRQQRAVAGIRRDRTSGPLGRLLERLGRCLR